MPISIEQNIKERVWDEIGPKMIRTIKNSYAPVDPVALAEEIFELIWPDIFKEMLIEVEVATEGLMDVAVRRNFSR